MLREHTYLQREAAGQGSWTEHCQCGSHRGTSGTRVGILNSKIRGEAGCIVKAGDAVFYAMIGRHFVALALPPATHAAICQLRDSAPCDDNVTWVPEGNLHVTLRFLGNCEADDAVSALQPLCAMLPPCRATIASSTRTFGDPASVLYLPVTGVDELAQVVTNATRDIGKEPDRRKFMGHITLAKARAGASLPAICGDLDSASSFKAESIVLLRSENERYTVVESFRLQQKPRGER